MEQKELIKMMMDFNKTSFDQVCDSVFMMQEQAESFSEAMLMQDHTPEEVKLTLSEWFGALRQSRKDFRESVDTSFRQLETYFLSLAP